MVAVVHNTVATLPDDPSYEIGTDEWNEPHALMQGGQALLGKSTAGAGPTVELASGTVRTFLGLSTAHGVQFASIGVGASPPFDGIDSVGDIQGRRNVESDNAYLLNAYYNTASNEWRFRNGLAPLRIIAAGPQIVLGTSAVGAANAVITWIDALRITATGAVETPIGLTTADLTVTGTASFVALGAATLDVSGNTRLRSHAEVDGTFTRDAWFDSAGGVWKRRSGSVPFAINLGGGAYNTIYSAAAGAVNSTITWLEAIRILDTGSVTFPMGTTTVQAFTANGASSVAALTASGTLIAPGVTFSSSAATITTNVTAPRITLPATNAPGSYSIGISSFNLVADVTVGYPAIGYNITAGAALNQWRYGGADTCSWIQCQGMTINFYRSTGSPVAGAAIVPGPVISINSQGQITSAVATGTAPFTVASTTVVANLSVQYLNGIQSTGFVQPSVRAQFTAGQAASTDIANAPAGSGGGFELLASGVSGTAGAAFMSFQRPGAFGGYFGLDTDNRFKVGGWSYGAVSYYLYHSGNTGVRTGWSPTFSSSGGGVPVTVTNAAEYYRVGTAVFFNIDISITGLGTASGGAFRMTLPSTPVRYFSCAGRDNQTGETVNCYLAASNLCDFVLYNGAGAVRAPARIMANGWYFDA